MARETITKDFSFDFFLAESATTQRMKYVTFALSLFLCVFCSCVCVGAFLQFDFLNSNLSDEILETEKTKEGTSGKTR